MQEFCGQATIAGAGKRPSAMDLRNAAWNQTSSMTSLEDERKGRLLGSNKTGGGAAMAAIVAVFAVKESFVFPPPRPICRSLKVAAFTMAITRKHDPRSRSLCVVLRFRLDGPPATGPATTFTLLGCTANPPASSRLYLRRIIAFVTDSYTSIDGNTGTVCAHRGKGDRGISRHLLCANRKIGRNSLRDYRKILAIPLWSLFSS